MEDKVRVQKLRELVTALDLASNMEGLREGLEAEDLEDATIEANRIREEILAALDELAERMETLGS